MPDYITRDAFDAINALLRDKLPTKVPPPRIVTQGPDRIWLDWPTAHARLIINDRGRYMHAGEEVDAIIEKLARFFNPRPIDAVVYLEPKDAQRIRDGIATVATVPLCFMPHGSDFVKFQLLEVQE